MLRRLIGAHIELVTLMESDLALVEVDPTQIEQILINLVVNARDAMLEAANWLLRQPTSMLGNTSPSGTQRSLAANTSRCRSATRESG